MKFTPVLALIFSARTVTAVPVAEIDATDAAVAEIEARDLTRGQCKAACDNGADAVERFCRLIPEARVRAACWAAATAVQTPIGQRACTSFCDAFF